MLPTDSLLENKEAARIAPQLDRTVESKPHDAKVTEAARLAADARIVEEFRLAADAKKARLAADAKIAQEARLVADTKITECADPKSNAAAAYLITLGVGSRSVVSARLKKIVGFFDSSGCSLYDFSWEKLTPAQTLALHKHLVRDSPKNAPEIISALRGVLLEAVKIGQMKEDDYDLVSHLPTIRKSKSSSVRECSHEEVVRLTGICDPKTIVGVRDHAIMGLIAYAGLRRREVVALNIGDFRKENRGLHIAGVKGKSRGIPLSQWLMFLLNQWVTERQRLHSASQLALWEEKNRESEKLTGRPLPVEDLPPLPENSPMFVAMRKSENGSKLTSSRLTAQAITGIFENRCQEAGIEKISPGELRVYGLRNLMVGADISIMQYLTGYKKTVVAQ